MSHALDHVGHEQVGELRPERPVGRAGERAVEVAAVGQVSGLAQEPNTFTIGTATTVPAIWRGRTVLQHPADDLQAVQLVAVDDGRQPQPSAPAAGRGRPRPAGSATWRWAGATPAPRPACAGRDRTVVPPMTIGSLRGRRVRGTVSAQARVRGRRGRLAWLFSIHSMIRRATSTPEVVPRCPRAPARCSPPCTSGPCLERTGRRRTRRGPSSGPPARRSPAPRAMSLIFSAVPPRCRLERNSPGALWRRMAATTRLPTTKARMSAPPASLMNSCTRMLASSWRKAAMTDSAALLGLGQHDADALRALESA